MQGTLSKVWKSRKQWVDDVGNTVLTDLRTPVMGENVEDMVFSDDSDVENPLQLEYYDDEDDVFD